jgi:hypothetical protein
MEVNGYGRARGDGRDFHPYFRFGGIDPRGEPVVEERGIRFVREADIVAVGLHQPRGDQRRGVEFHQDRMIGQRGAAGIVHGHPEITRVTGKRAPGGTAQESAKQTGQDHRARPVPSPVSIADFSVHYQHSRTVIILHRREYCNDKVVYQVSGTRIQGM